MVDQLHDAIDSYFKKQKKQNISDEEAHFVLIPDKHALNLPWESLPCLRGKSVSRLPSLSFLVHILQQKEPSVDRNKVLYMLNPSGDLIHTQKQFENVLTQKTDWYGWVGHAPPEKDLIQSMSNADLFMYVTLIDLY